MVVRGGQGIGGRLLFTTLLALMPLLHSTVQGNGPLLPRGTGEVPGAKVGAPPPPWRRGLGRQVRAPEARQVGGGALSVCLRWARLVFATPPVQKRLP